MALFSKKGTLGVDIGTSNIKIVETGWGDSHNRLETYGMIEIKNDLVRSESIDAQQKIIDSLKTILKKANARPKKAVTALPGFSVFSAVIELPRMSTNELASAVKWEAKRYVPFPVETMTLDWKIIDAKKGPKKGIIGEKEKGKEKIKVLLNAAPKNLVNKYVKIFKGAGLKLSALETEPFALTRSLVGNDSSVVAIVNVGSMATEVSIVEQGLPVLNKSADIGGRAITNAVANSLNISINRAEQFKRDLGNHVDQNEEIPPSIRPVLQNIATEVKNSLLIYQNSGGKPISKIILSGGSSNLPMLKDFLGDALDFKVVSGDPWARVDYPAELKDVLRTIGPVFGVAVGLAMRNAT